jgi:hypothetical protein
MTLKYEDFKNSIKNELPKSIETLKSIIDNSALSSMLSGTGIENILAFCPVKQGKVSINEYKNFHSPGSHNPMGDEKCDEGLIGTKSLDYNIPKQNTTKEKISLSMYRTGSIKNIKDKVKYISDCYQGMYRDLWTLKYKKDGNLIKIDVISLDIHNITELNVSSYEFNEYYGVRKNTSGKFMGWKSNIILDCYFKIERGMSDQVWFYCQDFPLFLKRNANLIETIFSLEVKS